MEMVKGITSHSIVVVLDKREKAVGITAVLKKQSHKVFVAESIYEALKVIDQEMPHLVIVDALLSDGSAGTLHDRLMGNELVKDTPILVLVAQKSKEYLTPLKGRQFAGFLLGKVDVAMVAKKVTELLENYQDASPYYKETKAADANITISFPAKVLGKSGDQVVYNSGIEMDQKAAVVCVSEDKSRGAALLSLATNKPKDGSIFNYFPLHRVKGAGRVWLENLPDLSVNQGLSASKKVLFYDPNQERFEQFQEVLLGYGIELVHANSLHVATALLTRDAQSFHSIFLDELNGSKSGITFKETYNQIDASSRPTLLVATSAMSAKSNKTMQYLHKPFGLGILVDTIHAACESSQKLSPKTANDDVKYQAPATLLGLDETGGILKLKFPVSKGTKLNLENKLLSTIWEGESTVSVDSVGANKNNPNVWLVKFTAQKAIGNKAKYWTKVKKHLDSA